MSRCLDLQVNSVFSIKASDSLTVVIKSSLSLDLDFQPVLATLLGKPVDQPVPKSLLAHYSLSPDGLLLYDQSRICVPRGPLRAQILHDHHDSPVSGHQGIEHTHEALHRLFYWPRMNGMV